MSDKVFWSDGPVGQDGIYISRKSDTRFRDSIFSSGLCYLLGPSQVGKSSLLDFTIRWLKETHGQKCVCVRHELNYTKGDADLYEKAVANNIAAAVFAALGDSAVPRLDGTAGPLAELFALLPRILRQYDDIDLFIFIDEVDTLSQHPPVAERFMLGLRGIFGMRASNDDVRRFHVALFGALLPLDIRFNQGVSPFNIGEHIYLRDMTELELQQFFPLLDVGELNRRAITSEVFRITSGQPFLTQIILASIVEEYDQVKYVPGDEVRLVSKARQVVSQDENGIQKYVRGITNRVLRSYPAAESLAILDLYERVRLVGEIDASAEELTHYATRLTGLVEREIRDVDDAILKVRNSIVMDSCGPAWLSLLRGALSRNDTTVDLRSLIWASPRQGAPSDSTQGLLELAGGLLAELSKATGRAIVRDDAVAPVESIQGKLYRFPVLADNPAERLTLQLFVGLRGLSGDLWAQEVRILQEVSHSFIGAVPDIMDGGLDEVRQIAWLLETRGWDSLDSAGTIEFIRKDPLEALRQFTGLVRGLSLLHQAGVLHRSIWPANIHVIGTQERPELMFTGFEFSTVIFGSAASSEGSQHKLYEQYLAGAGGKAYVHLAPERLLRLSGNQKGALEGLKSDIYSLGLVAYQFFVGPIPTALYESTSPSRYDEQAHRRALLGMQLRLAELAGKSLPAPLAEVIANMVSPELRNRPTTGETLGVLEENEVDIRVFFEDSTVNKKMLVCYSASLCGEAMAHGGLITSDYRSTLGRKEIQAVLRSDLQHGAKLFFCQTGFDDYVARPTERTNSAKYVLQGTNHSYFCRVYRATGAYGSAGREVEQALWIAYVYRKRIPDFRISGIRLDVRDIDVVSEETGVAESRAVRDFPSWRPFLDTLVRREWERDSWNYRFHQSTEWMLRMQQVLVQVGIYPVQVADTDDPSQKVLVLDDLRDERWRTADPFMFAASESPWRRPPLGRYCDRLAEEAQTRPILLFRRGGKESPTRSLDESVEVDFVETLAPNAIKVHCYSSSLLADGVAGWIESANLSAQDLPIARQRAARQAVMDMPNLSTQFCAPKAIIRSSSRSDGAGAGLLGEAPLAISEILNNWPFYVLQGPPGTGKTTIIARSIATLLKRQPTPRILVAAQSHFALDNVAKRVATEIKADPAHHDTIMIRIASAASQRQIDEEVKDFLPSAVSEDWRQEAISVCRASMGDISTPARRELVVKWHNLLETNQIEFEDRLKRSSNVVFCTTGAAHSDLMEDLVGTGRFDWVFIEEAAKAWLTELLMPMVYGRRWVLVGDHRQLPAFGLDNLTALLHDACNSSDADLGAISKFLMVDKEIDGKIVPVPDPRIFAPFESFMELETQDSSNAPISFGRTTRRLTTQFRMCRSIGNLVSDAFYEGELSTADLVANYQAVRTLPSWIRDKRLIWISTSELPGRGRKNNQRLENQAEAEMVRDIVESMATKNKTITLHDLAILSPYLKQKRRIEELLPSHYRGLVRTVDSFQGREADVVIVSLTRTKEGHVDPSDDPRMHVGFLGLPNRVNVMMSRAKAHLIVLGDFELYSEIGEKLLTAGFWGTVCRYFRGAHALAPPLDSSSVVYTYDYAQSLLKGAS